MPDVYDAMLYSKELTFSDGLVITLTNCIPLQAVWDPAITDAYCRGVEWFWVNTALHVVTDCMIWSVPIPRIWRMSLPRTQKMTLVGLFSLGFLHVLPSSARLQSRGEIFMSF